MENDKRRNAQWPLIPIYISIVLLVILGIANIYYSGLGGLVLLLPLAGIIFLFWVTAKEIKADKPIAKGGKGPRIMAISAALIISLAGIAGLVTFAINAIAR